MNNLCIWQAPEIGPIWSKTVQNWYIDVQIKIGYYGKIIEAEVGTIVLDVDIGIGKEMLGKSPVNPGGSGPPIKEGGIPPYGGLDIIGEVAKRIRSNSNSVTCTLFDFALLFWNHTFIWVSVIFNEADNSDRSEMDKYCF